MQAGLQPGPWVGGAEPGIVDVALIAYVDRLDRLGLSGLWGDTFLAISPWLDAWKDTAAYAAGIGDWVPEGSAAEMRAAGLAHWKEIETARQAVARVASDQLASDPRN